MKKSLSAGLTALFLSSSSVFAALPVQAVAASNVDILSSTCTVTVFTDNTDGAAVVDGTLRHCLENVSDGDTIEFDTDVEQTIPLEYRLDVGVDNLTIDGSVGVNQRIVITTAGGETPSFNGKLIRNTAGDGTLTLRGLEFNNAKVTTDAGNVPIGAAVQSNSDLVIEDSIFENNKADDRGGAVYGVKNITVDNSLFLSNSTLTFTGNFGNDGGAIHADGNMTITNSTFEGNESVDNGGALSAEGEINISDSIFTGNEAEGNGGGLYATKSITISGSIIDGNRASSLGGGAYAHEESITSTNDIVKNNSADVGGGLHAEGNNEDGKGSLTVVDSEFDNNIARGGSGGALRARDAITIDNSLFTENEAQSQGGAARSIGGSITSTDSTFTDNQSFLDTGSGGALSASEDVVSTNSSFTGNKTGDNGGAIRGDNVTVSGGSFAANIATGEGGAIYSGDDTTVTDAEFVSNTAYRGGAIYASISGNVSITTSSFEKNQSSSHGGAVYADERIDVTQSTFGENKTNGTGDGGALYSDDNDISVSFSLFGKNSSEDVGGAIEAEDGSVTVEDSLFQGNISDHSGGAIYAQDDFNSVRSSFIGNKSLTGSGGAVFTEDNDAKIENSYFASNSAELNGGAIAIEQFLRIQNTTFYANQAADDGGAIWNDNHSGTDKGWIVYSTFIANQATNADSIVFGADLAELFGNILVSSSSDQLAINQSKSNPVSVIDFGANISSSSNEPLLDAESSKTGISLGTLKVSTPETPGVGETSVVPIRGLSSTGVRITQELAQTFIDNAEKVLLIELPLVDQLGQTRVFDFFPGAEFITGEPIPSSGFSAPSPFSGPIVESVIGADGVVSIGDNLSLIGERLDSVSSVTVDDDPVEVISISYSKLELSIPDGVSPGDHEITLITPSGDVKLQTGLSVGGQPESEESDDSFNSWTKRLSDSQAKIYAKNPVGQGKVQFFVNGEEIAWIRATDSTDPKLRTVDTGPMQGTAYLVRTVELTSGKNALEVYVDGERVTRTAYSR